MYSLFLHIFFLVLATVKHYLKTHFKLDEVAIDLQLQQLGTHIAHKICDLNKPKCAGLKIAEVQSDATNTIDATQHESNSEKEKEGNDQEKEDKESDNESTDTTDKNKSDNIESDIESDKESNNESNSDSK